MDDYISPKEHNAKLSELFDLVDKTDAEINEWAQVSTMQDAIKKFEQIGKQLREIEQITRYLIRENK